MQLTKHFYLDEFLVTDADYEFPKTPRIIIDNLKMLCKYVLEPIRDEFGVLIVTSGWRPLDLQKLLGITNNRSAHIYGRAADIISTTYSPAEIMKFVIDIRLPVYQAIDEENKNGSKWIHVDFNNFESKLNGKFLSYRSGKYDDFQKSA